MSINRVASIVGKIEWSQLEISSLSNTRDIGEVGSDVTVDHPLVLESGDFNAIFHSAGILPSGGSTVIDLTALSQEIFGETVNVNMSRVKGICIESRPTISGFLSICSTGTGMWLAPFGQAVSGYPVYTSWVAAYPSGWAIGTDKKLILKDSGMGIPYSICVVGSSG